MDPVGNRSVLRVCAILKCFQQSPAPLRLAEIAEASGLNKATAYRMLFALVEGGMIERLRKNTYVLAGNAQRNRRYRIGYATQSEEFAFSRLVSESIRASAYNARIELVELNNRYSPTTAIRNAEIFAREGVDLVIEFQTSLESASTVASKLVDASIPFIAIEIPHPGAFYYGANNYRAGLIAGRALAHGCKDRWRGHFDELILLELRMAGPLVRSRLTGMIAGIREVLSELKDEKIRFINGNGRFETSLAAMRKDLMRSRPRKVLLGAINDPSCLGALTAFMETGRSSDCLAISHNGALEARREIRRPGSSLIGSVAYFPEQYGDGVIQLALDILQGRRVPPAVFVKHELLDRHNVDDFYPNDPALSEQDADTMLYSSR
jgi:ribose transport system substrate-binding protein